jgi:hypothetical protein
VRFGNRRPFYGGEDVNESVLPNEVKPPKTFLETAQSLQLQGEPDWSEKIDQYLSGETIDH